MLTSALILLLLGILAYVRRAKIQSKLTSYTGVLSKLESYDNSGNNWHGN